MDAPIPVPTARRVADALVGSVLCLSCVAKKSEVADADASRLLTRLSTFFRLAAQRPCDQCGAGVTTYSLVAPD